MNRMAAKQKDFSDSSEYFYTSQTISADSNDYSKLVTIQEKPTMMLKQSTTKLKGVKSLQHKPSKYHYHLKTDQIYGDKTLKLCGQCTLPSNLARDLRFLDKNMRRSLSLDGELNDDDDDDHDHVNSLPVNHHQHNNHHHPQHSLKLSKLNTRDLFDLHRSSLQVFNSNKFDIDFDVIDLTTERQSGPNLPIVTLPPDLFKFSQLKRLHLDCNQIRVVPDLLGENLLNLEILTLSNNCLKTLPESLVNLKKLTSIHLSSNQLENFPSVLCRLESLRFLDLCSNQLRLLDPNIGDLKYLESLLLFHNNLTELPPQIGRLTKLRTLWLGENRLTRLPREIVQLNGTLEWDDESFNLSSNIDRNPLQHPPLEVCLKGLSSIVEYFDQTTPETKSPKTSPKSEPKASTKTAPKTEPKTTNNKDSIKSNNNQKTPKMNDKNNMK